MSSIGSFGTFTTARLAIYVSQKGLSVTGNNIANINTGGYTRQRLDQVSFKTGRSDRYQNSFDTHVGNGAIAKSVSQLRDPYLDIRYRAEHSSEGYYNGRLGGLDQIGDILDEIGKGDNDGDGLLYAQFSDFFDALQHIQVGAGTEVNDTLASTSAETLCRLFYKAANQLEILKTNTEVQLRQEMDEINVKLINIRNLNEAIQQAEIYGDSALELRDQRNVFIDELSEKLKIEATYSMVDIGGKDVEKLTIRLANANPDKDVKSDTSLLVDGDYCAQLTTPRINGKRNLSYMFCDRKSNAYENVVRDLENALAYDREYTVPGTTLQPKTRQELENFIDTFMANPDNAISAYAYLDPNGEGTNDPRAAEQVFDNYYNITVSDLRDKNGKAWVSDPVVRDTIVKDTTGFPTKAKYSGTFKFSGTWKEGDKITVNDKTIEIGKDLTVDGANRDAKNVSNAIRKALIESGKFEGYDITTTTTRIVEDGKEGFNVQLNVKAKEPGEMKGELPKINISADTTANTKPAITVGAPAEAGKGQYNAEVTTSDSAKFHKGDIITIGTGADAVSLEVGKDLSVNAANDPARLATKLAGKMKVEGYTVSSLADKDGKAYLVFKATGDSEKAPAVPDVSAEAAKPVEFTGIENGTITNGEPASDEVKKKMEAAPENKPNGDNTWSRVITRYFMDDEDKWHEVVKTTTYSETKMLDDNDLFGELQAVRELLTEEGEFASENDVGMDENAAIKRGIPYYQKTLDLLARQFAKTMNDANKGFAVNQNGDYLNSKGEVLKDKTDMKLGGKVVNKFTKLTEAQEEELIRTGYFKENPSGEMTADLNRWLEEKGAEQMGGNLFSNRGDSNEDDGITAMNISVSADWNSGKVHVVPTYIKLFGEDDNNTTKQDNALHMGNLMHRDLIYNPRDIMNPDDDPESMPVSTHLFEGSFQELLEKMGSTLGTDQNSTKISLETHMGQALDIDTSRDSVSAVDLNDEAMNLMQYTHSLNAAYRLMTTIDDLLERLITGTGVTR